MSKSVVPPDGEDEVHPLPTINHPSQREHNEGTIVPVLLEMEATGHTLKVQVRDDQALSSVPRVSNQPSSRKQMNSKVVVHMGTKLFSSI